MRVGAGRGVGSRTSTRIISLLILLTILVTAAPITPASAQETLQNAAPAAVPGLAVARNEAVADFPEGITFTLDAETEDPIAALELLYRPLGVETWSAELPPFETGTTSLALEHPVDLRAGQLPPGVDLTYHWRIVVEDGDVVQTPPQTLLWSDDRYNWTPLSGPHVTVYTYDGDAAFQQAILDTAEQTIANLTAAYGVIPEQPIRVWAYTTSEDMYGAFEPNSNPHAAGVNRPDLHLILATAPPGNEREVKRVIPHEILHQALHQVTDGPFKGPPPAWLNEGLATYWQESGRDAVYTLALRRAAEGQVPPLRTLNGIFPYDGDGFAESYAFSLSAVLYILDTWGDEGMARLIAQYPEGITHEEAVQAALGISFDELDRQWREDLIADAERFGVTTGATRFDDSGPSGPSWPLGELLASATIILGLVVLIAVIAGVVRGRRNRLEPEEEIDLSANGLRWREWPDGLEPPGWQARSPGQP